MNKKCSSCGIEKPLTKFRLVQGKKKYGSRNECRTCYNVNFKNLILKEQGIDSWDNYVFNNFKDRIRSRTRLAFIRIKENKPVKTEQLLGCDWMTAKLHIETFFTDELNWDNFHEWHIDHIIPLCSVSTIEELIPLCKYTNLQPLKAIDNLKKGGRLFKIK